MKREVKQLFVCGMALALIFFGANAYSSSTTIQANGANAMTLVCSNNCSTSLSLSLFSSQSNDTTTTTVIFGLFGSDSNGNPTSIIGSGPVPASMLSGNGKNSLTLNLDTNAAGLQVQYCVADQNFNYTCTPYSGGVITVTWQTTNLFSDHYLQQTKNTLGPVTVHLNLYRDVFSATAQSNAFGIQFTDPFAQLGIGHDGTVEIDHP